jgi:hypothetical protein
MRERRLPFIVALAGLCALTLWLYAPGLHGPLVFDDYQAIGGLLEANGLPPDWPHWVISPTGPLGRPVSMLSFLANAGLFGNALWAWKLTNVLLHCVTGIALVGLARLLFSTQRELSPRAVAVLSVALGAWWLLHPLWVSTVLYTVQRMTQLSALFSVCGMLLYLDTRLHRPDGWPARLRILLVYLLCLPLAAAAKENGLLLPVFLSALELTVLAGKGDAGLRRFSQILLLALSGSALALGGMYWLRHLDDGLMASYTRRGFTLAQRLLTEARVLCLYFAEILAPSRARLGFLHDDIAVSQSFWVPVTTLPACLTIGVVAAAGWVLRRRQPLAALGLLWFLLGQSLESSVIPLELMFEHRNYLPSFGILLSAMALASRWVYGRLGAAALVVVLGLNLLVTRAIVSDWSEQTRLDVALYELHPRSPTAAAQLAERLSSQGQYAAARTLLGALPGAGPVLQRAYIECLESHAVQDVRLETGLLAAERTLSTYAVGGLLELSRLKLEGACELSGHDLRDLIDLALTKPTTLGDSHDKLRLYRAQLAWQAGAVEIAFAAVKDAAAKNPASPVPLLLGAEWQITRGELAAAAESLILAEARASARPLAYETLLTRVRDLLAQAREAEDAVRPPAAP